MAFPQFGYHNIGASLPGNQGSLLLAAASAVNPPSSGASSRQTEAPNRDAPASSTPSSTAAQCPCYPPGLLGSYPRMPGGLPEPNPAAAAAAATAALYGGAYPPGYLSLGAGEAVMNSMCGDLKSTSELGLIPGSPYFPAYELAGFPYHNGFALDPNARRKNATRESTTTLKAWLNEHRKNPYPTKGEKIMLAIITKMTLTQVSTWFANARRRLKKDNKVTWSPRNRGEDDDDDDDDENGRDKESKEEEFDVDIENDDDADDSPLPRSSSKEEMSPLRLPSPAPPVAYSAHSAFTPINHLRSPQKQPLRVSTATENPKDSASPPSSRSTKIWSLAEVASSKEHKTESDTPAFVTRGPTQQTFPHHQKPHPAGFSAFRPILHGVPPHSLAGGPIQWPGSPAGGPHPAYSYALSQHYLAMTMARPGFIPATFHQPQDSKHAGGRQDTKCSSPDSSRSVSPASPSQSPFRPHRPQATSSSSSSSLALAASATE